MPAAVLCFILLGAALQVQAALPWRDRFEKALGKAAAPEIIKEFGGEYAVPIHERMWLDEIFRRLTSAAERSELEYSLTVLGSNQYNAFALPGGHVFVTRGLLESVGDDEAKLASILGHEIAHIEKRHGVNAVLRQMGLAVVMEVGVMWLNAVPPEFLRVASATLIQLLHCGWGRDAEYEADAHGQYLAVQAGFDGIGAAAALDDLLKADPEELPVNIFSSHPDTKSRRARVGENLLSFWPEAKLAPAKRVQEISTASRNFYENGRTDPKERFVVSLAEGAEAQTGLQVYDSQRQESTVWLGEIQVTDFSWSPRGEYLAASVKNAVKPGAQTELWLCDRFGYVVKEWSPPAELGSIQRISWSPCGAMLALEFKAGTRGQIVVTYTASEVYLPVSGGLGGEQPLWLPEGLYFRRSGMWYLIQAPAVEPVAITNPVPRVLQRKRILSPTVIFEDNSIRLTRPSLSVP